MSQKRCYQGKKFYLLGKMFPRWSKMWDISFLLRLFSARLSHFVFDAFFDTLRFTFDTSHLDFDTSPLDFDAFNFKAF